MRISFQMNEITSQFLILEHHPQVTSFNNGTK